MRSYQSILFAKEAAGMLVLTVGLLGFRYVVASATPEPVVFEDFKEFRAFATGKGIFANSGNLDGHFLHNGFVADHPITFADLGQVQTRRDCGLTPAWHGILWICQINSPSLTLCPEQLGGKWRIWGNVLVAGDEALMDRIEALYRNG